MRTFFAFTVSALVILLPSATHAEDVATKGAVTLDKVMVSSQAPEPYLVGVDDIIDIAILQPDQLTTTVTVAPDGSISFPFIGNLNVKNLTLPQVQEELQNRLADGYMKYPVVSVSLKESRSRKFFVYGEVAHPGPYVMDDNVSVLRAVAMAGGFTKYGSSNNVKVLRPKPASAGYEALRVNIKALMDGDSNQDLALKPGDTVVVSEGVF